MRTAGTYRKTEHAPDPYLMDWTAKHLPPANSYFLTDLDLIIRTRSGLMVMIEIKRKSAALKTHQSITLDVIDKLLQAGTEATGGEVTANGLRLQISYLGYWVLTFENTTFDDGKAWLTIGGRQYEVSEAEAVCILSLNWAKPILNNDQQKAAGLPEVLKNAIYPVTCCIDTSGRKKVA